MVVLTVLEYTCGSVNRVRVRTSVVVLTWLEYRCGSVNRVRVQVW